METAIFYHSYHHGCTKQLLDAIRVRYPVQLYNIEGKETMDLSRFGRIGFASGIYYGQMSKDLLKFRENNLPEGKDVFLIVTGGNPRDTNLNTMRKIIGDKHGRLIGHYMCKGYDTFGPFRLMGGINKGHPDAEETEAAVKFYSGLIGHDPALR